MTEHKCIRKKFFYVNHAVYFPDSRKMMIQHIKDNIDPFYSEFQMYNVPNEELKKAFDRGDCAFVEFAVALNMCKSRFGITVGYGENISKFMMSPNWHQFERDGKDWNVARVHKLHYDTKNKIYDESNENLLLKYDDFIEIPQTHNHLV